jgi:hypothetical protein
MRNGAALPAVLLAITMTSALAVGGAFVSRQQAAAARFAGRGEALLPAAELALIHTVGSWDLAARDSQPVGTSASLATPSRPGPVTEIWVTRASLALYWVVVDARTTVQPVFRRRIGVLVEVFSDGPRVIPLRGWSDLP